MAMVFFAHTIYTDIAGDESHEWFSVFFELVAVWKRNTGRLRDHYKIIIPLLLRLRYWIDRSRPMSWTAP